MRNVLLATMILGSMVLAAMPLAAATPSADECCFLVMDVVPYQDDNAQGTDAPDSPNAAGESYVEGGQVAGSLMAADDPQDWYLINLTAGTWYNFTLDDATNAPNVPNAEKTQLIIQKPDNTERTRILSGGRTGFEAQVTGAWHVGVLNPKFVCTPCETLSAITGPLMPAPVITVWNTARTGTTAGTNCITAITSLTTSGCPSMDVQVHPEQLTRAAGLPAPPKSCSYTCRSAGITQTSYLVTAS